MKKFTKVLEQLENGGYFKVDAQVQLIVEAENEGEAGYLSDSILSSIEYGANYQIINIGETDERISENMELYPGKQPDVSDDRTPEEIIKSSFDAEFGDRTPTTTEKMEWYHNMRNDGYDGILILNTLKDEFNI